MAEVKYLDGNVNQAVIVHGPDPAKESNVLATPLTGTVSVPKESVTGLNDTPDVHLESAAAEQQTTDADKSEIQKLREEIASLSGKLSGNSGE